MKALTVLMLGPAPSVSKEDRQEVIYLAATLLILIVALTLAILFYPLAFKGEQTFARAFSDPVFWEVVAVHIIFSVSYLLLRAGWVRSSKYVAVVGFALFPVVATLVPMLLPYSAEPLSPDGYKGILLYFVMGVMFASAFLSTKVAIIFLGLIVAYIVVILNVTPGLPSKTLVETLESVITISIFLLILTWQKDKIAADRRKHLESLNEDLHKSEQKAQESNKLKTEFLAVTSHELKTPLNSILGFTDCILNGIGVEGPELSEDQRVLLERVRVKSKDLLCSINDILDMSRLEAQKVEVVLEPFSPSSVIFQHLKDIAPQLSEKGLTLKSTIASDIPEQVVGDVHLLSRILSNLLLNAVKFTERGFIEVKAHLVEPNQWQVAITDTGVGIPPDKLEAIFQPFRQVDSSTTRYFGGTGLGLAIARSNARLLGGDVTVRSQVCIGSTFTVTLPLIPIPANVQSETVRLG